MVIAGAALALSTIGGCVSYTNVPEPESAPAFKSANHLQAKQVTAAALGEIVERYPMRDAQGRYSVNLPAGTSLESAQEIVADLPDGVVIPFEGMDSSIPTYHIGRIWIRASGAKVDVLYPSRSFDGTTFIGNATVWFNGGLRRWQFDRIQHWAPGTIPVPPTYVPIPGVELEALKQGVDDEELASDVQDMGEPMDDDVMSEPERRSEPEPVETQPVNTGGQSYREVPVDD